MLFTDTDDTFVNGIYKVKIYGTPKLIGRVNVTMKFDIVLVVTSEDDIDISELSSNLDIVTKVNAFVSMIESVDVLVDIFRTY